MKRFLVVAFSSLSLCFAQDAPEEKKISLEELREGLGSDDFKDRQKATKGIWEMGEASLSFLAELEESADPELAARATKLRDKIRCGILPDTPDEIVKILENYLVSNTTAKKRIAEELKTGNHFEYLYRLFNIEEDPEVKDTLNKMVQEVIPNLVLNHLNAGELEQARSLLKQGTHFQGLIRYGNFLSHQGELEDELAKLKDAKSSDEQARYLAYLRVKGDVALLLKEARRLGDQETAATAALLLGDFGPAMKIQAGKKRIGEFQEIFLRLAEARRSGDSAREEKMTAALMKLALDEESYETRYYSRAALYAAGLPDQVAEVNAGTKWENAYNHAIILDRNKEAGIILGLENGKVKPTWLKKKIAQLKQEWADEDSNELSYTRLLQTLRFLEARGEYDQVSQMSRVIFDAAREVPDQSGLELAERLFMYCPRGILPALAREVDEHELALGELLNGIFERARPILWLYGKVRKLDPELSTLSVLELLSTYAGYGALAEEEFEKWDVRLLAGVQNEAENGNAKELQNLDSLWRIFGSSQNRLTLLQDENFPKKNAYLAAGVAMSLGKWEEASKLYETLDEGVFQRNAYLEYLRVLLLQKLNQKVDVEIARRKVMLCYGGDSSYLAQLSVEHSRFGDEARAYQLLKTAALRSEDFILSAEGLLERLANEAMYQRDWRLASALKSANLFHLAQSSTQEALNGSFEARFTEGLALVSEGKREEGVQLLEDAHGLISASGTLADYFFPALRDAGLTRLHDRLCQKTLVSFRANVAVFPRDHSNKNTFAWVAARANRNLDEADQMIREALEGDPLSPALLDTMAEVQFARGKRDVAVMWSERSLALRSNDLEIQRQYRRFQKGEFPKP